MKNIFKNTLILISLLTITSLLIIIIPEIATLDNGSNSTIIDQDPNSITITQKENFYYACFSIGIVFIISCFILFRFYYLELQFYNWNNNIEKLREIYINNINSAYTHKQSQKRLEYIRKYNTFYNNSLMDMNIHLFLSLHKWKAKSFSNDQLLIWEVEKVK